MDVVDWLRGLGLERYEAAFREHDLDDAVLPLLTPEDLAAIGIASVGHRRRLLDAIAALRRGPPRGNGAGAETPAAAAPARGAAERRQLTVMFVDLVGSTALTSRLDPEEMRDLFRAYQDAVAGEILRFEGHVAKFMGDGVLAYFGWPHGHEDEAERAVRAGLAITAAVARLQTPEGRALSARIGIATGLVVVGELVGEGSAREETVVGETPNLAARLQALAEPGAVVIAPATRQLLGNLFELEDIGVHPLKGFAEPLRLWRVQREGKAQSRFEALHGSVLTPFVGREHEVGLLLERFQQAKDGEGQVVLLSGEAGIGKSRLIGALRERLRGEPYMLLSHFCSPFHVNSAFQPVIGMLERLARFEGGEATEDRMAKLADLLAVAGVDNTDAPPLLAALLSIPASPPERLAALGPDAQKRRTLEVLIELVAGLSVRQPVLAVYEDLHWVDPSTLELLGQIVERVERLPILCIFSFRPDFNPPWPPRGCIAPLPLGRLGRRQGASLIEVIAGGRSLPPELRDQIAAKTDGVPLFLEELTKSLLESGQLHEREGRYELAGALPSLTIPSTLQDSLVARLDRLGAAKETVQLGAALGREFSYELLAAVSPLGEADLKTALGQIAAAGLLLRRGNPPDVTYIFQHALIQDAAYAGLLKRRRQEIHSRIAQVMVERFPSRVAAQPELLAHHHTEAGEIEAAADRWLEAGRRSAERSAIAEAVAHLKRGLEIIKALPAGSARDRRELDLLVALGVPLIATKGYGAAEIDELYSRARELCEQLDDPDQLLPVIYGQSLAVIVKPDCRRARALAADFLDLAEARGEIGAALVARRIAGFSLHNLGELQASEECFERVLALYDPERDRRLAYRYSQDPRATALAVLSIVQWLRGYPDRSARTGAEALAWANELGHANTFGYSQYFAGCMRPAVARDWAAVRANAAIAVPFSERKGMAMWQGWIRFSLERALAETTPTTASLAQMRATLATVDALGTLVHSTFRLTQLAVAQARLDRIEEGLATLDEASAFVEATGERWWEAEICRLRGELLRARTSAQTKKAEACFEQALAIAGAQKAKSLELRAAMSQARLLRDSGERAAARDLLALVHGWFTEGFDTPDLIDAKALLEEVG